MSKQPVAEKKAAPRPLLLLVGLTAGVLAGLTVEVQLAAREMSVAGAWTQLSGGEQVRFASASVIWAIAGVAFAVGAAAAGLLAKYPPPWREARVLRWIIGTLILFGLAHVAHGVETPHGVTPGTAVLAGMSVIVISATMALFGAFFARPR